MLRGPIKILSNINFDDLPDIPLGREAHFGVGQGWLSLIKGQGLSTGPGCAHLAEALHSAA